MKLLFFTPACGCEQSLLMDRAYEGDNMRATAKELGYTPVVPPKKNRIDPWEYDEELYKRRNEVERFFRRIKRFRRVFTRYDKLDIVFAGFILFAMIVDALVGTDSNEIGGHLCTFTVYNHFKRVMDRMGLHEVRLHDLRHTYSVLALQNGMDYKTLSNNLGHATVAFTMDVYGHVSETMMQNSAEIMQRYIESL